MRKLERISICAVMLAVELMLAVLPAILVAKVVLPAAYIQRGYAAFGGEWLAIFIVACISFCAVNHFTFGWLREEAKRNAVERRNRKAIRCQNQ